MTDTVSNTSNVTFNTAVLFLVFNRPDTTARVFEAIRQAKPSRLYVAADGPRASRIGEAEKVAAVRAIATAVDWPCEVKTLFGTENLGCKHAVSRAITWFFEQEEQGIILEDDCLPHPDFFVFCQDLLVRYADDERVAMITGDNFQNGQRRGDASYYFSKFNHIWGWASWRRAWQHYDVNIALWPEWNCSSHWNDSFQDCIEQKYWQKIFNAVHQNKIDTWDYQWTVCVWRNNGLTATPNVNLISNIGFGAEATHTLAENNPQSNMPTQSMGKIIHPLKVERNAEADRYVFDYVLSGRDLRFPRTIFNKFRRLFKKLTQIK
ncbi:MAG: nucleotide-diphospho-sugar transferase [Methylomonas sp.]|nr:nucleotide-diphospho-sugar transferase [Methylomonas sp.]PPD20169.1 MAG: hemolytic protein HlpA-like protein [Methylomonas sp.]PPD52386.1 MAG: hemolytic protein HlpA-like protein [Methylomonas sp.]